MAKMLLPDSSPVTAFSVPATVLFDGTRWSTAVVCAALLTVTLCQAVHAAPGDLDPSFDADGKVLTDFRRGSRSTQQVATAVVVQRASWWRRVDRVSSSRAIAAIARRISDKIQWLAEHYDQVRPTDRTVRESVNTPRW